MKPDDITRAVLARDDVARYLRGNQGLPEDSARQRIEKKLGRIEGVDAVVNLATEKATVRYAEPRAFAIFAARCNRQEPNLGKASSVLLGLLDTIIDRLADFIERIQTRVETLSHTVLRCSVPRRPATDRRSHCRGQTGVAGFEPNESILSPPRRLRS